MLLHSSLLVLVTTLIIGTSQGCSHDDHPDRVHSLPGLNMPLPSRWYSGYLEYEFQGQQVHTHYTLVEAEDIGDGKTKDEKPLIYWSNGGPGASSLYGLLTEIGPLLLSDLSLNTDDYKRTGYPTPIYNPYAWTRFGTILIFDQPAPVGFSYCNDDHDSHSCGGIAWTDELTSQNAYIALQTFYETHPCYQSKELYLTGESYAGIYIPTLARRVVEGINSTSYNIDLKGFAVGDGCLGTETNICGVIQDGNPLDLWALVFLAGHNQIPLQTFRDAMKACRHDLAGLIEDDHSDDSNNNNLQHELEHNACIDELAKVHRQVGGFFAYSLYDECTYQNGLTLEGAVNDYPCGGGHVMEEYFKLDVVKDALHVRSTFFEVDNAEGDFDYTPTEKDLTGFYKQVNGKLKVIVYNGDTDPAITSFAAQNWTSHLGLKEVEEWRPWTVDNCQKMGGYVTRYEGMFDFLTIRGAGHMVPTYKPEATFAFMKAWIEGSDYLTFDRRCKQPDTSIPIRENPLEEEVVVGNTLLRGT